ncbi:MAG TPA: CAP domain-containing protein, partial [Polyangiaceae bacterium]|nr:CAP domain-containing protein [Polyangiaceae bacterium]
AGSKLRVTGNVSSPADVAAVGIARVNKGKPMKARDILKTYSYAIPKPYVIYFKKGFKTPIPLDVTANAFSIEVPLSDQGRPGLYSVSVWAKVPQTPDLVMISLRTIEVD